MKPITVAICMKANEELEKNGQGKIFDPDEKIKTSDGFFPGRKKPIKDGRRHNFLNLNMAIQKSSNIYMGRIIDRLINKLGEKWYRDALINIFEFNQKTNIEYPMEELGLIPRFDKCHPNGTKEWSKATPYSLAIGYNLLANSFQMIKIFSAFANGGYLIKPTFLKKIVSTDKNKNETIILDNTINFSLDNKKRILSEKNCKRIIEAMKYTTKLGGTASAGDIYGYTECGKSGTAEKIVNGTYSKNVHISSFIGIAPADNPRFVLMVVIDEPEKKIVESVGKMQQGGVCAAPVFREIAIRSLNYLGVKPDDPYGYPPSDPRRDVTKASWLNEVQELKNLYMSWNESITPTLKGTGLSREAQE
jgi:cell division protein FtsI (penicillin-binding protein 3)